MLLCGVSVHKNKHLVFPTLDSAGSLAVPFSQVKMYLFDILRALNHCASKCLQKKAAYKARRKDA